MTIRLLILAILLACVASHASAQLGLPTPGEVAAPPEPSEPHAAELGAQPATETPEGSPAEPSPTAPSAPTATPSPAPLGPTAPAAVSAGTSTGISAVAQGPGGTEPEEEEAEKPWLPWMAAFAWSQGYAAAGLSQSAYQTFNPTYAWAFLLTAGYNFSRHTALTLNQYAVIELTNSDTTITRQQLLFYDTSADLSHKLEYPLDPNQKLAFTGSVGLVFPTAKSSQAASVILGTRARVGATYSQKRVLEGLDVGPSFGYQRRWNSSNTTRSDGSLPCALTGSGPSQDCLYLASVGTTRDILQLGLDANLQLTDKLVAGLSLTFYWIQARSLGTYDEPTLTGPVTLGDMSTTHWFRNQRWLLLSLGYRITDWFTTTARITNIFYERGMAGQLRSPFNPIDTVLGLELAVSFDQLYLSSQGHGETKR